MKESVGSKPDSKPENLTFESKSEAEKSVPSVRKDAEIPPPIKVSPVL